MALADIISVMPPATWYELPGTKLSSVYAITDTGDSRYGVKGPKSVPEDWCGGAFDTDNHIFLLHGGGHRSYGGNEVYEFSLDTLTWTHNTPSTYVADVASSGGDNWKTTDGAPTSVHSYGGLQCIPGTNKLFKFGGARWESGDPGDSFAYLYDTVSKTWERKAAAPTDTLEPATAYDASRHCIWVWGRQEILRYNITPDTWDTVQSGLPTQTGRVAAYDPVNDRLVAISARMTPNICYYDCANGGALQTVTVTGTIGSLYETGLAYDTTRQTLVMWAGGREVYSLDPTTWVATQIDAGTGATPPSPGLADDYHGTYSKFHYLPDYDAFIGYNKAEGNAWIYKAGVAGSGPSAGWGDPQRQVAVSPASGKVTGSHTGFTVLLTRANLPDEMFDPSGSFAAQVNGGDIRITADQAGTIRLPIDLRPGFALDSATGAKDGKIELWTKLPSLDGDTSVYVWYHSAAAQVQPGVDEPYGRNAVWGNLIAGWHINSASTALDITGGGGDLSISGASTVTGPYTDSAVNVDFNATCKSPSLALNQDYTVSLLITRPGNLSTSKTVGYLYGTGGGAVKIAASSPTALSFETSDDAGAYTTVATGVSLPTSWTHYGIVSPVGLSTQQAYSAGALAGSVSSARRAGDGIVDLSGGAATSVYWAKLFIRQGLSSADWLATEAANQTDPNTFFVAGTPQTPPSYGLIAEAAQASDAYAAQALAMAAWNDAVQAADGFVPVARVAAAITESVLASESDGEIAQALALFTGPASGNALIDALGQVSAALAAGTAAGEAWTAQANALADLVSASASGNVLSASATQALQAAISEPTQASAAFVAAIAAIAQITAPASAAAQFDVTSAAAPRGAIAESAAATDALIATVSVLVTLGAGADAHDDWSGVVTALDMQLNEMVSAAARLDAQIAIHASMQASGYAGDTWLGALAQIIGVFMSLVCADSIVAARATVLAVLTNRVIAGSAFAARLPGNGYLIAGAITLTAALSGTITLKPN